MDSKAPTGPLQPTSWRQRWRASSGNLVVIVMRLASIAAGLAFVKSYTGALSTAEVGAFFYLSTLSYGINALVFVPFDFYLQARVAAMRTLPLPALGKLTSKVLAIGLLACMALSAPLIWFGKLRLIDFPALYAVAALLFLCSSGRNLLNNRGQKIFVSFMTFLESLGRLAAFVAIATLMRPSASTLMVSSAAALGIECLIILRQASKRLSWNRDTQQLDRESVIVRNVAPISGSAVCNAAQLQSYRIFYPLADLGAASGIYGVVSNIGAAAMAACSSIFSQIFVPRLYQSKGKTIKQYTKWALLLAGAVLLVAIALAPWLVALLTKPQYVPYSFAIAFGVITEACNLVIGGYTVYLSIERRTGLLLRFNVIAATISIGGCVFALLLFPQNPYLIGISLATSQIFMTLGLLLFTRKE